jgi:hypothetical protein
MSKRDGKSTKTQVTGVLEQAPQGFVLNTPIAVWQLEIPDSLWQALQDALGRTVTLDGYQQPSPEPMYGAILAVDAIVCEQGKP